MTFPINLKFNALPVPTLHILFDTNLEVSLEIDKPKFGVGILLGEVKRGQVNDTFSIRVFPVIVIVYNQGHGKWIISQIWPIYTLKADFTGGITPPSS